MFSPLLCHCSHLTYIITACPTQRFAILLTIATVLFSRNFTQSWLNSYWLRLARLFIRTRTFALLSSWVFYREYNDNAQFILVWIIVIGGLFIRCSMYLLVCICVHTNSCCVYFRWVCVIYPFHTNGLCFYSLRLLFSCERY